MNASTWRWVRSLHYALLTARLAWAGDGRARAALDRLLRVRAAGRRTPAPGTGSA